MPLTVTLEISDQELAHFRAALDSARHRAARASPGEIVTAARAAIARLRDEHTSPFVARRLDRIGSLVGMLEDSEWQLPEPDRRRVLHALAYVAEANDLVPDNVPVLGLLDDAIMLELVLQQLRHELEGYEEFDAFRRHELAKPGMAAQMPVSREEWLESKRRALHDRIRERRERDLELRGGDLPLITHF